MLSKRLQSQKTTKYMSPWQRHRHRSRLVVARGWEEKKWGVTENGYMGTWFPLGVMKKFYIRKWVLAVQLCEYTKTHYLVHFKRVNFMVYELYFNIKMK